MGKTRKHLKRLKNKRKTVKGGGWKGEPSKQIIGMLDEIIKEKNSNELNFRGKFTDIYEGYDFSEKYNKPHKSLQKKCADKQGCYYDGNIKNLIDNITADFKRKELDTRVLKELSDKFTSILISYSSNEPADEIMALFKFTKFMHELKDDDNFRLHIIQERVKEQIKNKRSLFNKIYKGNWMKFLEIVNKILDRIYIIKSVKPTGNKEPRTLQQLGYVNNIVKGPKPTKTIEETIMGMEDDDVLLHAIILKKLHDLESNPSKQQVFIEIVDKLAQTPMTQENAEELEKYYDAFFLKFVNRNTENQKKDSIIIEKSIMLYDNNKNNNIDERLTKFPNRFLEVIKTRLNKPNDEEGNLQGITRIDIIEPEKTPVGSRKSTESTFSELTE